MSRSSLRTLLVLAALALLLPAGAHAAAYTPRQKVLYHDGYTGRYLLGGPWYLRLDPLDQGLAQGLQRRSSLSGWSRVSVPNAWNAGDLSDASQRGGVAWYRTDFRVPAAARSVSWVLRFESVNYRARVYLNGHQVGTHEGAYLPFEVPANRIRRSGVNHLVVRVDSRRSDTDLPPLVDQDNGTPGGGWWNYGGILREVYLRKVDRVNITDFLARPALPCRACTASVLLRFTLHNVGGGSQRVVPRASVGGVAAHFRSVVVPGHRTRQVATKLRIDNPRLWEPGDPQLYRVGAGISIGGRSAGGFVAHIGIRSIKVRDGRLLINGVPTTLRGASMHEESVGDGNGGALSPADRTSMFNQLLDLGAGITRTHYPFHPETLEMADRAGVLVWDEIPMYRLGDQQLDLASVRGKGLRELRAMVQRDQNHPSVLTWSIGNELPSRPNSGQTAYIKAAHDLIKRMDPTRLIATDIAGYPSVEKQFVFSRYLTGLGLNDYFGWYPGPGGQLVDRNATGAYFDQEHEFYPRTALFVTEYGAESNHSGSVDEKGSYEFQTNWMAFQNQVFDQHPFINGAIAWILRDFKVRPGWDGGDPSPQPPYNQKGVADQLGHPKPVFAVLARLYENVQRAGAARIKAADAALRRAQSASR
ncbi:MAG TPA: glycoside hydrolase family 2 TIM barrel-domain containing protein [Solirubrobacterales bacterium]|nr:glycoside hydrolase family 2 TIM barrel-domain containing protein [Solirubrobacterales bacterium]